MTWNENKFEKRESFEKAIADHDRKIYKLNQLVITKQLSLPKKYVSVVLDNIVNIIGIFLQKNKECVIELNLLGSFSANQRQIYHYQRSKVKSEKSNFKRNASVQSLIGYPVLVNKDEKSIKIDKDVFDRLIESKLL